MIQVSTMFIGLIVSYCMGQVVFAHPLAYNNYILYNVTNIREFELNLYRKFGAIIMPNNSAVTDDLLNYNIFEISEITTQIYNIYRNNQSIKKYKLHYIDQVVTKVDELYKQFRQYLQYNVTRSEIENWCKSVNSDDTTTMISLMDLEINLYDEPNDKIDNVFVMIAKEARKLYKTTCNNKISMQLYLFEMIKAIIVTEIRYYTISYFAYKTLELSMNEKFTEELDILNTGFWYTYGNHSRSLTKAMAIAPRHVCIGNPQQHHKFETFFELEKTFQYVIDYESNLNRGTCTASCETIPYPENVEVCSGQISNCEMIGNGALFKHGKVQFSISSGSQRNYEWFRASNGTLYGRHANAWQMYKTARWQFSHDCDVCACLCTPSIHDRHATQSISLLPQTSDIENNMVVTGVKFEIHQAMIHIKIKQGKLLPTGRILNMTEKWKPVEDITWWNGYFYLKHMEDEFRLFESQHYARITRINRIISLSDVIVPPGHVITGVRIRFEKTPMPKRKYWPLSLEVRATPFNFVTGELIVPENDEHLWTRGYWPNIDDFKTDNYAQLFDLNTFGTADNPMISLSNTINPDERYSGFTHSDLKRDAGQSTVPFFDTQKVEMDSGFALDGIGLTRKGYGDGGGFLTLKLFTIDLSKYITPVK